MVLCESYEAKINDLNHLGFFFDQDIVKFDISMSYALLMKIVKCFDYLFKESSADWLLNLSIMAVGFDILMNTNAINIISYNTNLLRRFY